MDIGQIGGAVATVATIIAAVYAALGYHRSNKRASTMSDAAFRPALDRHPFFIMLALVVAAWAAVLFDFYTRDIQPSNVLVEQWGAQPPVYSMIINTKELFKYKASHKVMTVVRVNFADRDPMTDTIIEKSGLYTITGGQVTIAHRTTNTLRFACCSLILLKYIFC